MSQFISWCNKKDPTNCNVQDQKEKSHEGDEPAGPAVELGHGGGHEGVVVVLVFSRKVGVEPKRLSVVPEPS